MSVDRKFNVVRPSLDRLVRESIEVATANLGLLNPNSTSPVALVDGELIQYDSTGKAVRATDAAKPSWFCIDDRGDPGVQASRKLTAIVGGGAFQADTVIYDSTSLVVGSKLMYGNCTIESLTRAGVVLQTGSNIVVGYVLRLAAANGNKLRFVSALT